MSSSGDNGSQRAVPISPHPNSMQIDGLRNGASLDAPYLVNLTPTSSVAVMGLAAMRYSHDDSHNQAAPAAAMPVQVIQGSVAGNRTTQNM
ncbi:hypothetical protein GGI11_003461, partial [Coemansia sp. RSA 2049]